MQSSIADQSSIATPASNRDENASHSIVTRIKTHASAAPSKIAITCGASQLTFQELEQQAGNLAQHLRSLGAAPETCVAIFVDRSSEFIVAALAVLKSGAAYLPLDPSTPSERLAFILSDAGCSLVVTRSAGKRMLPTDGITDVVLDNASTLPTSGAEMSLSHDDTRLAYVVYTSGSAGRPKGVEVTHANLCNLIAWHQSAFQVTSDDRVSQVAGLGFDATAWEIWPALTAGASVHIADEMTRRSPQALRDWLVAHKITVSFAPTILAEQLIQSIWPPETALRILLTGADTLHRRPAPGLPFTLVNNYGPTECTVVTTSGVVSTGAVNSPDQHDHDGPPSIGRPIANATVFILDGNLRPVPTGEVGELCVAGALVARGYRGNPEQTARSFVTYMPQSGSPIRIYRTGDRAKLLEHGEIAFLGRLDDQVKIRGYRIELGEIVTHLDRYPGVDASELMVRDGADSIGPQLVAYLVIGESAKLINASDLREFLAQRLPEYMIPVSFVRLPALPITPNGKVDKAALPPATLENTLPSRPAATGVATDITPATNSAAARQRQIADMVALLLGQPLIAPDENFFMVGGHSMFGVQLVARLRDMFGVKLTLRQLFSAPTVTALAAEVEKLTTAAK